MAQQMPSPIDLFQTGVRGYRQTLGGVRPDQMANSTPCSEWNVQSLINHNIRTMGFMRGMLQENITVNPMDVSGPLPGANAMEAFNAAVDGLLEVVQAPGAVDKEIETPFGRMTMGQVLMN